LSPPANVNGVTSNDDHIQDAAWFGAIHEQLDNGGYEGLLHDLLNLDIGDFHPRQMPHDKNALLSQQIESLSPFDAWWVELLEAGTLPGCDPAQPNRAVSSDYVGLDGNRVDGLLTNARKSSPRLRNLSDHLIGAFLAKLGGDNSKKVMRKRGWTFPSLAECRATWMARFPTWKWRDQEVTEWQP
jgi:hypothetical protein